VSVKGKESIKKNRRVKKKKLKKSPKGGKKGQTKVNQGSKKVCLPNQRDTVAIGTKGQCCNDHSKKGYCWKGTILFPGGKGGGAHKNTTPSRKKEKGKSGESGVGW